MWLSKWEASHCWHQAPRRPLGGSLLHCLRITSQRELARLCIAGALINREETGTKPLRAVNSFHRQDWLTWCAYQAAGGHSEAAAFYIAAVWLLRWGVARVELSCFRSVEQNKCCLEERFFLSLALVWIVSADCCLCFCWCLDWKRLLLFLFVCLFFIPR